MRVLKLDLGQHLPFMKTDAE